MTSDQLKRKLKHVAAEKGHFYLVRELVIEGLSPSLAGQLSRGVYISELKSRSAEAIKKVLKRCD